MKKATVIILCAALLLGFGCEALAAQEQTPLVSAESVQEASQEPTQEPVEEPVEEQTMEPAAQPAVLTLEGSGNTTAYTMGEVANVDEGAKLSVTLAQAEACYYVYTTGGVTLDLTLATDYAGQSLSGLKNGSFVPFDGPYSENVTVTITAGGTGSFALYTLDAAKANGYTSAISVGESVTLSKDDDRIYTFTASQAGYYFFCGKNATLNILPSAAGRHAGILSDASGVCYFSLKANESVYFTLESNVVGTDTTTLTFNAANSSTLVPIAENTAVSLDTATAYCFTPTKTGLYLATTEGTNATAALIDTETAKSKMIDSNSVTAMELTEGATYLLRSLQSGTAVKLTRADSASATALTLDGEAEVEGLWALYSFTAQTSGFYTITADGVAQLQLYNGNGLQTLVQERQENAGGGEGAQPPDPNDEPDPSEPGQGNPPTEPSATYIAALAAGETAYFLATGRNPNGSTKLALAATDTSKLKTIEAKTYESGTLSAGVYVFTAPASGMYCLRGADATVTALSNGNTKTAYEIRPALFYLQKDEKAVIEISLNVLSSIGTVTLGPVSDAPELVALTVNEQTQVYKGKYTLFMAYFTAPADGLYVVKMPEGNSGGATTVAFLDNTLRQYNRTYHIDETDLCCSFVCNLKKGETVYVWGRMALGGTEDKVLESDTQSNSAIFTVESVTVYGALGEIDDSVAVATTDETRQSVQTLGTDNLTEAMNGSESAAIADKMALLEEKLDDSTCTVATDAQAGVSSVSIIGAQFNTPTNESGAITLTVLAGDEQELPEQSGLSEENAVYLQLQLDGVAGADELTVPVYITVAVPEDLDGQRLRLVHYGESGTEILSPVSVYSEDGTWYARFVVTGFSPFALAELAAEDGNDDDGDEATTGGNSGDEATTGGNSGGENAANSGKASPKTGDESALLLWLALAAFALAGLVPLQRRRRER